MKIYFKNSYGFTLIEMLVTVLIIGVLAGIAFPQYEVAVRKSHLAKYMALVKALEEGEERYKLATGSYTAKLEDLDVEMPVLYDFCSLKKQNSGWYYDCTKNGNQIARYGLFNNVSNAQAGDGNIRYLHVFKNYTDNGVSFKKGDIACFSKNIPSKKACKSALIGATEYNGSGWTYIYVLRG